MKVLFIFIIEINIYHSFLEDIIKNISNIQILKHIENLIYTMLMSYAVLSKSDISNGSYVFSKKLSDFLSNINENILV